jgi:hypothetical protein
MPSTNRRAFLASDIYQADNPSEFLAFIESTYLSGGGALILPASLGYISGMTLFRASASGTGLGALVVLGSEGVCAYGINAPRGQWQSIDLANVLFLGNGTESPSSIITVNDDILFRARDGWRFVKYTSTQAVGAGGSISNVPQSFEMSSVIALDSKVERPFVSSAFVDNRILMTAAGNQTSGGEVLFDALISLDTANISSVSSLQTTPAYDGIWTGHKFLQVLRANYADYERAFIFVRVDDRNELWYVEDSSNSYYLDGMITPIEQKLVTRVHSFQAPRNTKEFKFAEEWLSNARGTITLGAYWRADGYELWNACVPYTFNADVTTTSGSLPQSRWRLRLPPAGVDTYDPVSGRDVRSGSTFQFCFTWTGAVKIDKVLLHSVLGTEPTADTGCSIAAGIPLLEGTGGVVLDMYDYVIPPLAALDAGYYWDALALGREPLFYWTYTGTDADGNTIGELTIVGPTNGGTVSGNTFPQWPEYPDFDTAWATPVAAPTPGSVPNTNTTLTTPWVPTLPVPALGLGDRVVVPTNTPPSGGNITYITYEGDEIIVYPEDTNKNDKTDATPAPNPSYEFIVPTGCLSATPGGGATDWKSMTVVNNSSSSAEATLTFPAQGSTLDSKAPFEIQELSGNNWIPFTGNVGKYTISAGASKGFRYRTTVDSTWDTAVNGKSGTRLSQKVTLDMRFAGLETVQQPVVQTREICTVVTVPTPVLSCGSDITISNLLGNAVNTQASTISNTGDAGSTLTWTAVKEGSYDFITMSPMSGSITGGNSQAVTITVDPTGIDAGTYSVSFVVTGAETGVLPCSKTVTVTIYPLFTGTMHCVASYTTSAGGSGSTAWDVPIVSGTGGNTSGFGLYFGHRKLVTAVDGIAAGTWVTQWQDTAYWTQSVGYSQSTVGHDVSSSYSAAGCPTGTLTKSAGNGWAYDHPSFVSTTYTITFGPA